MKLDWKILAAVVVVAFVLGGVLFSTTYGGGWGINNTLTNLNAGGVSKDATGLKSITNFDPDGDINLNDWFGHQDVANKPGISIESGIVGYYAFSNAGWTYSSSASLIDSYTLNLPTTYSSNSTGNITTYHKQIYQLYVFGYGITIKTAADVFFKDRAKYNILQPGYWGDFGYYYEAAPVTVDLLTHLAIMPWAPVGAWDQNWTMNGGWSGVLSAFVISCSYGLVEQGVTEKQGHTIQNLNSVNSALNMFVGSAKESFGFRDSPAALAGIPSAVDIEVGATLAAGASPTVDSAGHWDSCSAHNVFVTYVIGAEVLTTYLIQCSHVTPLQPPDENNTNYHPQLPGWLEYIQGLFAGAGTTFSVIVLVVVVGFLIIIALKVLRPHR